MALKLRLLNFLISKYVPRLSYKTNFQKSINHLKTYALYSKFNSKPIVAYKTVTFINAGILTALGIRKKEEEPEDPLIYTIKLGVFSMQKEEFDNAEQYLHLALKMAQERNDQQASAYIYDILANVAFQKGDFNKAETLFVEVLKHLVSTGMPENDNAIVEISLKMAAMFSKRGLIQKAETGYEFCITTQQKKLDEIDMSDVSKMSELDKDTLLLWAMSIDWYARHLLDKGKLKEAQMYFEKAYTMSEKINGQNHHQTLVLMNDIGSVATLRENYNIAIDFLQKAIERGRVSGSPDISSFYCNLGATYLKKGDKELAFTNCNHALILAKKMKQAEAIIDATGCLEELKKLGWKK